MRIRKAVLPVAGAGTRFLPATKVVPKELLPIVDKPVIQYLVEEAVASGIEEIIFVLARGKELIREHFSPRPALETMLSVRGKEALLAKISGLPTMARFHYVYQESPRGDGDALLYAEKLVGDEPFLVLFGDDIVKHPVPAARQLIDHFTGAPLLAAERVPRERIAGYGVIDPGAMDGRLISVKGLVEKPAPAAAPSDIGIIGKYVCPPAVFDAIRRSTPGKDGELRLIDGFSEMLKTEPVQAYIVEGERFDTGHPAGLVAANNAFLKIA